VWAKVASGLLTIRKLSAMSFQPLGRYAAKWQNSTLQKGSFTQRNSAAAGLANGVISLQQGVKTSVEGCKISSCLLLPIEKQLFPSAV
jgi:hypothetical protein